MQLKLKGGEECLSVKPAKRQMFPSRRYGIAKSLDYCISPSGRYRNIAFIAKKIIKRSSQGVDVTCCLVHEILEEKITDCEQRIKALKETKKRLSERLRHWVNPKDAKNVKFAICPQIEQSDDVITCVHHKKGG